MKYLEISVVQKNILAKADNCLDYHKAYFSALMYINLFILLPGTTFWAAAEVSYHRKFHCTCINLFSSWVWPSFCLYCCM